MPNIIATRSAYLEFREERNGMQEGYRFLDEQRLILAGELLRELAACDTLQLTFDALYHKAVAALKSVLRGHGLEELALYPALQADKTRIESTSQQVLGIDLVQARLLMDGVRTPLGVRPSMEVEHCRGLFTQVVEHGVELAARQANLQRLWNTYSHVSRRARALEDMLLPEVERKLRDIDASLEEQDREEAIRVRHFTTIRGPRK